MPSDPSFSAVNIPLSDHLPVALKSCLLHFFKYIYIFNIAVFVNYHLQDDIWVPKALQKSFA